MGMHREALSLLYSRDFLLGDCAPAVLDAMDDPEDKQLLLTRPRAPGFLSWVVGHEAYSAFWERFGSDPSADDVHWDVMGIRMFADFHDITTRDLRRLERRAERLPPSNETTKAGVLRQDPAEAQAVLRSFSVELGRLRRRAVLLKRRYAEAVAARLFHDREYCWQLSRFLAGFAENKPWAKRPSYWPKPVLRMLWQREGQHCARCDARLTLAGEHVDHMFPLALGGCNDVLNLQLLCAKCNLDKRDHDDAITSSIPDYLRPSRELEARARSMRDKKRSRGR